ncbi:unnamed protein product [Bursaphelenchus xylophilus]|uniref:(pine wood nematode) hypothetical protein n=1 Tax=Bursaphelenchus xylophilus TaxID=6326 RepID=A0A1I7S962_BURXY|nr:unnamed protein product [Bursaphelenchus xylophilus]CAG9086327.1 unnamed protein product [Bursaphelenchus xylophilus]
MGRYPYCTTCDDLLGDSTIKCYNCYEVFHRKAKCTGISADNLNRIAKWFCYICDPCFFCHGEDEKDESYICDGCNRNFHLKCLDPPLIEQPTNFYEKWFCRYCSTNICMGCWFPMHSLACDYCYQCQSRIVCAGCNEPYEECDKKVRCSWCSFDYHVLCEDLSGPDGKCQQCKNEPQDGYVRANAYVLYEGLQVRKFQERLFFERNQIKKKFALKRIPKSRYDRRNYSLHRLKMLQVSTIPEDILEKLCQAESFFGKELLYNNRDETEDHLKYFEKHEKKESSLEKVEDRSVLGLVFENELRNQLATEFTDVDEACRGLISSPIDWMATLKYKPPSPSIWRVLAKEENFNPELVRPRPQRRFQQMINHSPRYPFRHQRIWARSYD